MFPLIKLNMAYIPIRVKELEREAGETEREQDREKTVAKCRTKKRTKRKEKRMNCERTERNKGDKISRCDFSIIVGVRTADVTDIREIWFTTSDSYQIDAYETSSEFPSFRDRTVF